MKIIFRNLARSTTADTLLALFQNHGRVQSCVVVMDPLTGGSKGFGFANMPVPGEAKAAIRALNGMEVDGSRIRVKKAVEGQKNVSPQAELPPQPDISADSADAPQAPREQRRLKKDGTPLGPRKARTFRRQQDD